MGTPVNEIYGAMEKRATLFHFSPFELTIVGLDRSDEGSVLADPDRIESVDEDMVASIQAQGIDSPVKFRKNGNRPDGKPNVEVVFGRNRVMACREVWKRMRKAGVKDIDLPVVPAVLFKGSEADALAVMITENLVRKEETPLSAAKKAARFYALTKDLPRTALVCKVSVDTLKLWFAINALSPAVHEKIKRKDVSAHMAAKLLKDTPVEEQAKVLDDLIARGAVKGLAAESELKAQAARGNAPAARGNAPATNAPVTNVPLPASAGKGKKASPSATTDDDPIVLPGKRDLRRLLEELDVKGEERFLYARAVLAFALDGTPLKGPLRTAWKHASGEGNA